jgi:glycosyltransferase involved in cell wall biosynthesis
LVINESLSLGKPVICTDVIGASEMVVNGENGFKIPPRSPEILADCIKSLVLDTELRERLSKNALRINEKWNSNLFLDELKKMIYST